MDIIFILHPSSVYLSPPCPSEGTQLLSLSPHSIQLCRSVPSGGSFGFLIAPSLYRDRMIFPLFFLMRPFILKLIGTRGQMEIAKPVFESTQNWGNLMWKSKRSCSQLKMVFKVGLNVRQLETKNTPNALGWDLFPNEGFMWYNADAKEGPERV